MAAPYNDNIKEKILSSTKEILERKSFNEITLASIAKATGVSKGTIYYYYKNKDMILADVADSYFESMYKELKNWAYNKEKDTSLPRVLNFVVSRGVEDEKKSLRFLRRLFLFQSARFVTYLLFHCSRNTSCAVPRRPLPADAKLPTRVSQ